MPELDSVQEGAIPASEMSSEIAKTEIAKPEKQVISPEIVEELRKMILEQIFAAARNPSIKWDGVEIHYTTGSSRTVEGSGRFQVTDGGTDKLHITAGDAVTGEKVAQITIDTLS